jgi:hypothetical protein
MQIRPVKFCLSAGIKSRLISFQDNAYRRDLHFEDLLDICFIIETIPKHVSKVPQSTFDAICNCLLLTLHKGVYE